VDASRYGAKVRYGVLPAGEIWKLCCETPLLGRFDGQNAALCARRRAACQPMGRGVDAELHVLDVDGEFRQADPASFGH
jgi:hypothetical protein